MTIYQEEMQRKAQHYGCITSYDEADQLLLISHKGVHLTAINPEGFMFYNSKDITDPESREVFSHLTDDAETVREYVGLYESSPQMKPKDVQNYRKLSEYGDVVFAGMYSQKHGFMFCSWRQSDGGKYVAHGNYSPDYLVSKENFAVRAGLVDDNKLFTKEEAEELFKCAAFARDNCESLTSLSTFVVLTEPVMNSFSMVISMTSSSVPISVPPVLCGRHFLDRASNRKLDETQTHQTNASLFLKLLTGKI